MIINSVTSAREKKADSKQIHGDGVALIFTDSFSEHIATGQGPFDVLFHL